MLRAVHVHYLRSNMLLRTRETNMFRSSLLSGCTKWCLKLLKLYFPRIKILFAYNLVPDFITTIRSGLTDMITANNTAERPDNKADVRVAQNWANLSDGHRSSQEKETCPSWRITNKHSCKATVRVLISFFVFEQLLLPARKQKTDEHCTFFWE